MKTWIYYTPIATDICVFFFIFKVFYFGKPKQQVCEIQKFVSFFIFSTLTGIIDFSHKREKYFLLLSCQKSLGRTSAHIMKFSLLGKNLYFYINSGVLTQIYKSLIHAFVSQLKLYVSFNHCCLGLYLLLNHCNNIYAISTGLENRAGREGVIEQPLFNRR